MIMVWHDVGPSFGSYIVKKSGSEAPGRISLRSNRLCERRKSTVVRRCDSADAL
jgi:hypothetical protein